MLAEPRSQIAHFRLLRERAFQRFRQNVPVESLSVQATFRRLDQFAVHGVGKDAQILHRGVFDVEAQLHAAPSETAAQRGLALR